VMSCDLFFQICNIPISDSPVYVLYFKNFAIRHSYNTVCEVFQALVVSDHNHSDTMLGVQVN